MALQPPWHLFLFRVQSALSFILLLYLLGLFLLLFSALTSAYQQLLRPHFFWASVSSSNTILRNNRVLMWIWRILWSFFSILNIPLKFDQPNYYIGNLQKIRWINYICSQSIFQVYWRKIKLGTTITRFYIISIGKTICKKIDQQENSNSFDIGVIKR